MNTQPNKHITLIGGGIMSATLGILLKELNPNFSITIYERLGVVAAESSDAMNNAGTGHSAFCELNYTPQKEDETIDCKKAIKIASAFELSKSFWAYLMKNNYFDTPESFINNIPHISFVWGDEDVDFLQKRFLALQQHPLFAGIKFSQDKNELMRWMPLVMQQRKSDEKVAATKMDIGTDVNFGNLTRTLFTHLTSLDGVELLLNHEVRDLDKQDDGTWLVQYKDLAFDEKNERYTDFVFIGAGGGALPLLEKSNIQEAEGYGGFPISGQWLVCKNENVIAQHNAKVYGKAKVGAPPMSVPHLDTRMIDGKKELLFGPFAGFSTKFLKNGSYFDLPLSIEFDNIIPMLSAGWHNIALTKYLIQQVSLTHENRMETLREYLPSAKNEDWELAIAGQRVQVIKKDEEEGGVLEFGTELVHSADGSIAALLGASPGASTAVSAMLDVLEKCFSELMQSNEWKNKLQEIIPLYNAVDVDWLKHRKINNGVLHLDD
ncbi:MAG: malate dehydrogenase (quinone) [Ferruginibacter sp.]|nr:malate dehydrogenase (quinone) [Ferruginibacter sp.]